MVVSMGGQAGGVERPSGQPVVGGVDRRDEVEQPTARAGEPTVGLPSPKLKRVSPMSSRITSPTAGRPPAAVQGITVLVAGFTHGLKLGELLRRKLLWTENSTVVPLTTDQLMWL